MQLIKTIKILPVDDRPCHTDMVLEAMKNIENYKLDMAPKEALGHFMRPADTNLVNDFLFKDIDKTDILILSIDALCYGGLVQGRSYDTTIPISYFHQRLEILEKLKAINPELKILAYSVIMRLTVTVTDTTKIKEWEDIFLYSQLVEKVKTHPELEEQLNLITKRIDASVLENYLLTRDRNHQMNISTLKLLKNKILDYAVLVQEDTHEYGLHKVEQEKINRFIHKNNLESTSKVKNGTDEMVALLIARVINKNTKILIEKNFLKDTFVAPYEDLSVMENLHRSLEIANIKFDDSSAQIILEIIPPKKRTFDLAFESLIDENILVSNDLHNKADYKGNKIAVLDISYANGGDIRNLEFILNEIEDSKLIAYSAWNTSSNAIGTLILDCVIADQEKTNQDYLKMRLIDDALYQGIVRSKLNDKFKKENVDLWKEIYSEETNSWITSKLNTEIKKHDLTKGISVKAQLPWGRTFEVRMEKKNE